MKTWKSLSLKAALVLPLFYSVGASADGKIVCTSAYAGDPVSALEERVNKKLDVLKAEGYTLVSAPSIVMEKGGVLICLTVNKPTGSK